MATTQGQPISNITRVSISISASPVQGENVSTMLVLGSSDVIDAVSRMRSYSSLEQVAADFMNTAPEYISATRWFAQRPQPLSLNIGRWVSSDTTAQLIGGSISAAAQQLAEWTAIVDGSLTITANGDTFNITGADFSSQTNLNGVATRLTEVLLNAELPAGTVAVWNANYARFDLTLGAPAGPSSTLSFASLEGTGTDLSARLAWTAVTGAYIAQGQAAETALQAVETLDNQFSNQWYGLFVVGITDSDALAIAAYIEGTTVKHYFGCVSQEAAALNASGIDTSSLPYQLSQLKYDKTAVQWSSSDPYCIVSYLARILPTNWRGNNTAITLMMKQEPGVVAENLNRSQLSNLLAKQCNVYVIYNIGAFDRTGIIQPGVSSSGQFTDTVIGADWFAISLQTDCFNTLFTTPTKIPQTDAGMHILATVIENDCIAAVNNGLAAPGTWNTTGFGIITQGSYLPKGYYIYQPPIAQQNPTDRAARMAVPFQIALKLAGAVHETDLLVTLNP